jgi:protein O-mannosyl-transferase
MSAPKNHGRDRVTKPERDQKTLGSAALPGHLKTRISRRSTPVLCILLAVTTVALFSPAGTHPFTNYDDPSYVSQNPHVKAGLTWTTVKWAFESMEASNWHPVTWLSHAADCELYGVSPAGHHWTNILIHALNAILLFVLLQWATGAMWQSLAASALFAVHPLNVESVTWISERKNVLSTFFLLLTLGAYGWYAQRPSGKRYAVVVASFVLGLMTKPMLVTLPFLLLLTDYWPLHRFDGLGTQSGRFRQGSVWQLVLEKTPLLLLSVGSAAITLRAQETSLASIQRFPLPLRLQNALVSYVLYLKNASWPSSLALYYPQPEHIPACQWIGALLLLAVISIAVWKQARSMPFLMVGWFWFLAALVPVLGIIQVGAQSMADRYAYVPLIGIFVALVWLLGLLPTEVAQYAIAAGVVGIFALLTWHQLGYWKTNVDLWSHTLAVTRNNPIAEDKLGSALQAIGRQDEAVGHFSNALQLNPHDPLANFSLGADLQWRGRLTEAIPYYEAAIRHTRDTRLLADTYQNLATDYMQMGDLQQARENFLRALSTNPELITAFAGLGELAGEPARTLSQAVVQRPTLEGYLELARAFQQVGRVQEAKLAFAYAK